MRTVTAVNSKTRGPVIGRFWTWCLDLRAEAKVLDSRRWQMTSCGRETADNMFACLRTEYCEKSLSHCKCRMVVAFIKCFMYGVCDFSSQLLYKGWVVSNIRCWLHNSNCMHKWLFDTHYVLVCLQEVWLLQWWNPLVLQRYNRVAHVRSCRCPVWSTVGLACLTSMLHSDTDEDVKRTKKRVSGTAAYSIERESAPNAIMFGCISIFCGRESATIVVELLLTVARSEC